MLDGVRTHLRSLELSIDGVDRDLIGRPVDRVIIGPQAVELRLTPSEAKEPPELHPDELDASAPTSTPLMLPWEAPAFVAVKGIVHTPTAAPPMAPEARDALLAAIAKARGWIEELRLGRVATLAEIAECEGLGEHVLVLAPLTFVAPRVIAAIADGSVAVYATVHGARATAARLLGRAKEKAQSVVSCRV
jgi:site-specific DNA recombinase